MSLLLQHESGRGCVEQYFWNPLIPLKDNIFIWRVFKEAVPTRFNLATKGIHLQSLACVFCEKGVEKAQTKNTTM